MITFKEFLITEARKNPSKNISDSPFNQIKQIADEYPNAFITFTDIPKFGANPQSKWNTPLGICSYPIQYYIDLNGKVPYAGLNPYIFVFTTDESGNFLDLDKDDPNEFANALHNNIKNLLGITTFDFKSSNIMYIWQQMYNIVHRYITKTNDNYNPDYNKSGPYSTITRKILMKAGYDGVIDPGLGVIHKNEPNQAVFFNIKKLKVITMIKNKSQNALNPEYQAPIKTLDQWTVRLAHATNSHRRDRDVEKTLDKFFDQYMAKYDFYYGDLIKYATNCRQRIPVIESRLLKTSTQDMMKYAKIVIKGRWPEAEPFIMKDPQYAFHYALDIIKGRWPVGEPIIISHPQYAFYYAKDVIKRRWPEAEPSIMENSLVWGKYKNYFGVNDDNI